jgi:hypothetical protein
MTRKSNVPLILMLLGMALALAALVALFILEFAWEHLVFYLPALGAAAALIFLGRARAGKEFPPAGKQK